MPSLKTRMRDEFPVGWWHSMSWWWSGLRGVLGSCAVVFLTPVLLGRVRRTVRWRNQPALLAGVRGSNEAWSAALIFNLMNVVGLGVLTAELATPEDVLLLSLLPFMAAWWLMGAVLGSIMLFVRARSRIRHRGAWKQIDFVEDNAPKHGRPPETIDEYRALKLKAQS